ncbi:hypothetical protein WJX75_004335 [Coccomyxa subellipsoidea]|uniref:Uncharacterized protein n=1 Tax=Coccomyxa subellipsoidea TaxID=248742 RepID=A0ABR2YMG6_9CHLO
MHPVCTPRIHSSDTPVPAPESAPATPASRGGFPGTGATPGTNTPGGTGGAFPGRVAKTPGAEAPAPAAPRTGLPGGYNYAGNNAQVAQSRAAAGATQQAASTTPTQPKERVTAQATRSAEKHRKKKVESADAAAPAGAGSVGEVTSSSGANTAAAAAQPAATSSTVGTFTTNSNTAPQATSAAAQPQAAAALPAAGATGQVTDAGTAGSFSVMQQPTNLVATSNFAADGTFYTGDGQVVQKTSQGSVPPAAASTTTGQVGSEQSSKTAARSNPQVGSIDVDNNSRSALGNSKAAASAPTAGVNASGRRHLAQADLGAVAQQFLAGLANGAQQGNQAAASQAGLSSQPLGGQVQTNNLQNSAASGASSNAAAADQSGVVSGKAYQSASATSPLTPYNTAMENSIGNVVQQVTSSFGKQPGSNLQQQSGAAATSDIAAANQFTEPTLPANREIVSFNVPHADFPTALAGGGAGAMAGRKLQDAAGMISPPQPVQEAAPLDINQAQTTPLAALQHLASTITEQTGPTALRNPQPMAASSGSNANFGSGDNSGYSANSGYDANSEYGAASGNAAGSGISAAAAVPADYSSSAAAQPASGSSLSGAAPFAASSSAHSGDSAGDSASTPYDAGYGAQPMAAASQALPAGGSDETNFNAGRGANAAQSLGGLTGVAVNLLNGRRLQALDSSTLDNVAGTVAKDSSVQAAAVSLVKAASTASGGYWTSAPSDTAAAMKVIQLAVADKASVAAATQLASAVRTAAITAFGSSLPESLSTAASHLDVASLVQDPSVQSAAVPVLQAAAAAAGNSWDGAALGLDGAAEATVASAVADTATVTAARSLAQTVVSQTALMSFGTSLGNLLSGRRLQQANFGNVVSSVTTDPAVQAAALHVLEAANTEVAALQALRASDANTPAQAPAAAAPLGSSLTALQQLVSSVSHNAIATALPFTQQTTSSSAGPTDWEAVLSAPGNAAAAAAAAQKDSSVVKKFDAAQTAADAAASVKGAVTALLPGAGGRRLAAAGDGQAAGRKLQSDEGLFPNLGTSMSNTLTSLSTNARTMEENAAIELAKHVVRTLGVDSNTQGFATPHSQYGYNPIAAVVPYGSAVNTAATDLPPSSVSTDSSGTVTASALNGEVTTPNAAGVAQSGGALPLAAAMQAGLTSASTSALGRRLLDQAAQQTGPSLQSIITTVQSLASAVQTALSPSSAPQASSVQASSSASLAPQPITTQGTKLALSQPSFQAVSNNGYGGSSYGGSSGGGGGGKVGVTQATTYSGEGGNQLSTNDIHLDNSASNFVIGPDGKVPSLASQGGAAAVAQQLGLLVPNGGTQASQSVPSPPASDNSGYGGNYGNYGNQQTPQQSPSYGSGSSNNYNNNNNNNNNQSPTYGYGSNSNSSPANSYGSNGNSGYGQNTNSNAGYGSNSNAYSPSNSGSTGGTPNTVTAYNTGSYGASSTGNGNQSGPTVQQGSSYAAPVNSLETQSTTAFANAVPYNPSQQGWSATAANTAVPAGNNGWQAANQGAASYQQSALG